MQLSTSTAIRKKYPQAKITISSPFPEHDRSFYDSSIEIVPCHRRRLIFAGFQLVRASTWRILKAVTGYSANWLIPDVELQATQEADVVVDLSGDMLTDDYGPHVAWSHYIPILHALILGRPVFICAQSIGPFRWTGWIAKRLFNRAAVITVRDRISLDHLKTIGVREEHVRLTADMAFLLEASSSVRADEILTTENITLAERPLVGVSVSRILETLYNRENGEQLPFTNMMACVLDDFASRHQVDLLFIPHVTGPSRDKDDRRIGAEVAKKMTLAPHLVQGDYRPEELKSLIQRCDLFVGARMHANIAALCTGVPVIALSYSHKTLGIMALFGQSSWVVDGAELNKSRLSALLEDAWIKRETSSVAIQNACQCVKANSVGNLDFIETTLEKELQEH